MFEILVIFFSQSKTRDSFHIHIKQPNNKIVSNGLIMSFSVLKIVRTITIFQLNNNGYLQNLVIYQVVAVNLKMPVLWDVAPYSLVEVDLRFRGGYCLHHQDSSS
jgi:hypothetical protein